MRFVKRFHKVFQLPIGEQVILLQAWGLFLLVDVVLRMLTFKRLPALWQKLALRTPAHSQPSLSLPRFVWLVEVASCYVPVRATCLKTALVLAWILGRRGVATTLRLGVSRQDGWLTAHAWLERDGQVILGALDGDTYEPLLPG